ncbi:hypothetical protein ACFV5J_35115 [Streptomyces zaomyceticus]|uniref:hypothetical protein n=1 Tax=Streptomyces zaomyceticus TaxID=68286 RepID=UPI00198EDF0C|nr:hypothetical protein [Streptomyces zaomyceticus]GHG29682.1 hypothetical protein GCM10018791_52590 [Streptomyces zaomyceticus]
MTIDQKAAQELAGRAHEVGRASGRERWRDVLQRMSRGRFGRRRGWVSEPELDTPWQDTASGERHGWRERAANLDGEVAFSVDYLVCQDCQLGWVEQPYTLPEYQRCGLASAGLAALRIEHEGLSWHTLGGHLRSSKEFWAAVGADVSGGYQQRVLCPHITTW